MIPGARDKPLFTPGPLTTSATVKQAMLRDLGSRDAAFVEVVADIRRRLLAVGGVSQAEGYEAIILQGSGTFGVEGMLTTAVPRDGKLLLAINGAYGRRMRQIAAIHGIATAEVVAPEDQVIAPAAVAAALDADPAITHVAVVHCETTTGIMNPLAAIGAVVAAAGKGFLVDAMSAFGGVPTDVAACRADFLVSSANKCIEGVPGFSFALARRAALLACEGNARTLTLDLLAQWQGLERNGQFRFTPPTHALLAFHQALVELAQEGGVEARYARYQANQRALVEGLAAFGLAPYLEASVQGPIITSFPFPAHPAFDFQAFYDHLNAQGYVIYPGKLTQVDCFRIGSIGRLFEGDVHALVGAIGRALAAQGVR